MEPLYKIDFVDERMVIRFAKDHENYGNLFLGTGIGVGAVMAVVLWPFLQIMLIFLKGIFP